jgi:hypothetical protein
LKIKGKISTPEFDLLKIARDRRDERSPVERWIDAFYMTGETFDQGRRKGDLERPHLFTGSRHSW